MNADGKQPHILCIDHSPEILALLKDLLEDEGYRVTIWTQADKDLTELIALGPDLITLDYMWSTIDNDWSFLQLIRLDPHTRKIPVILCTGAVREVQAMEDHLERMDVSVVFKPFDIEQMLQSAHDALGREAAPTAIP
jgi:CheY-like chemotaxis protein